MAHLDRVTLSLVAAGLAAVSAAQELGHPTRPFDVWIVQDGKALPAGEEVTLKRAPFDVMIRMRPGVDTVSMHASPKGGVFERASSGGPLPDVFRGSNSMAPDPANADREMFLADDSISFWTSDSNFSEIRRIGRAVEGRHTVATFRTFDPDSSTPVEKWKGKELYLVFEGKATGKPAEKNALARLKVKFR